MPLTRQVYLLNPRTLDPETIAVTFAKTSRSPQSFHEIAAELSAEKSAEFHEKWVVGYGHSSVAEHAVLHIAAENISRLAVETLESNRLASYTEKSTRYQKWSPDQFFVPPELSDHPLCSLYLDTCAMLFDLYQQALPAVQEVVACENPPQPGESQAAWDRRCRSEYVDVCRFLLPASSLANVGLTINARALEHALRKMFSHPLLEVRSLAEEIRQAAQAIVPTLVKYVSEVPYLKNTRSEFSRLAACLPEKQSGDWCQLVSYDREGENRVLAAAIYRFGSCSFADALNHVEKLDQEERRRLAKILLDSCEQHDIPLRELEYTGFVVDLQMDQGGYFELKRHRMMTQTPQSLTTRLGYAVPRRICAAGFEPAYHRAMAAACSAYEQLAAKNPEVAAYIVPNAFNRRVLLSLNLRSANHLLSLRTAQGAHFSMRRAALRLADEIRSVSPLFGSYLRCTDTETWQEVEAGHFSDANYRRPGL